MEIEAGVLSGQSRRELPAGKRFSERSIRPAARVCVRARGEWERAVDARGSEEGKGDWDAGAVTGDAGA